MIFRLILIFTFLTLLNRLAWCAEQQADSLVQTVQSDTVVLEVLPDTATQPRWKGMKSSLEKVSSNCWYQMSYIAVPLFVVGGLTYNEGDHFRDMRNQYASGFRYHYDDYLQYAPAAIMVGMKVAGVQGRSSWGRMLVSDAFSAALMAGMVNGLKYSVKKMRPDGSTRNSFPSGHTATAFMTATMLHKEYGMTRSPLYSIGGYAIATATAVSRQLNNKHWFSDVLVGAGIGIFTTELGYYLADLIFKDKGLQRREIDFDMLQVSGNPSFFGVYMGYSLLSNNITLGNDIKLSSSGGTNAGLEGAWFFNRYVGIGGKFSVINSSMRFDSERYFSQHPDYDPLVECIESDPISIGHASVGPYFSYPFTKRWLLGAKMTFGYSHTQDVKVVLKLNGPEQGVSKPVELINTRPGSGFGLNTGLSLTRILNRNLGVRLFVDYNLSATKMEHRVNLNPINPENSKVAFFSRANISYFTFGASVNAIFW